MRRGPKDRRTAALIGNAVRVMEIATGRREEEYAASMRVRAESARAGSMPAFDEQPVPIIH